MLTALVVSYSLGDAIDWKRVSQPSVSKVLKLSYSLGDAIDWKPPFNLKICRLKS